MATPLIGDEAWEFSKALIPVRRRRFRTPAASRSTVDSRSRRFCSIREGESRGTTCRSAWATFRE